MNDRHELERVAPGPVPTTVAPGPAQAPTFLLSRRVFLTCVAGGYALAFAQLLEQVQGLFGARGIAPVATSLQALGEQVHGFARLQLPTLLWFGASDGAMLALCIAGVLCALTAMAGFLPRFALLLCWVLYLSFVCVGEPFLYFQWDALLLETGLLAVVFAPDGLQPFGRTEREPSPVVRWLVYWLLFRLLLLSGLLKLCSGDSSWQEGKALDFHYWTQPLPHRLSHFAHWWPGHALSLWIMFAIELGVPLLLVVPVARRRCRQVAAAATVLLMAAIAATGNYGFFNLLTAVLCVPLLDDRAWRMLLRRPAPKALTAPPHVVPAWRRIAVGAFAVVAVLATTDRFATSFRGGGAPAWPVALLHGIAAPVHDLVAPLQSFHSYGLFRVMTRERPELLLEGSDDGVEWRQYGFRYKPLDEHRAPVFAGLYMPRLDWQLWFAALSHRLDRHSEWTLGLLQRVLEGSPEVLLLLGDNPFPQHPPKQVRLRIAPYEFSTPDERAAGRWWRRGEIEPYSGAWTLVDGKLRAVR